MMLSFIFEWQSGASSRNKLRQNANDVVRMASEASRGPKWLKARVSLHCYTGYDGLDLVRALALSARCVDSSYYTEVRCASLNGNIGISPIRMRRAACMDLDSACCDRYCIRPQAGNCEPTSIRPDALEVY